MTTLTLQENKSLNNINPKKLLNSKWSAVTPQNKEKHFIITEVEYDEEGIVTDCVIQAVMTKRDSSIDWRDLKDTDKWRQGWS